MRRKVAVMAAVTAAALGAAGPAPAHAGGAAGLAGAWSFDEAAGPTAQDSSDRGGPGTIRGAARTVAGRFGGALSFDGVDDWVTIPLPGAVTPGVTLEAWVRPARLGGWRTVALGERDGALAFGLYAAQGGGVPSGHIYAGGDRGLRGPARLPLNTWSHLALTHDGAWLRLYVDGAPVAAAPLAGLPGGGPSTLRLGGNGLWGEWFSGLIDEVRVYDRALAPAEIVADRDTPIATVGLLTRRGAAEAKPRAAGAQPTRLAAQAYGPRPRATVKSRAGAHRPRWLRPRAG